jgi:hypothetical protein
MAGACSAWSRLSSCAAAPLLTSLRAFHPSGTVLANTDQLHGLRTVVDFKLDRFSSAPALHLYCSYPKQSLPCGRWHRCIEASRHYAWGFCRRCSSESR